MNQEKTVHIAAISVLVIAVLLGCAHPMPEKNKKFFHGEVAIEREYETVEKKVNHFIIVADTGEDLFISVNQEYAITENVIRKFNQVNAYLKWDAHVEFWESCIGITPLVVLYLVHPYAGGKNLVGYTHAGEWDFLHAFFYDWLAYINPFMNTMIDAKKLQPNAFTYEKVMDTAPILTRKYKKTNPLSGVAVLVKIDAKTYSGITDHLGLFKITNISKYTDSHQKMEIFVEEYDLYLSTFL